jgi:hypothetical protein
VGETVGLVSRDDKKEEHVAAAAPSGSAGAAPATNSAAYAEWERKHKEGGILSSIADAARTALVPPPLSADPSLEVIEPIKPKDMSALPEAKKAEEATPKEEEKPSTFLGNLLHKVEKKIEEALPMVAPHAADKKEEAPHAEDVRVSALGPVWDKEEAEAGETSTGKLESAEEKHGPAADQRDASMEPLSPVGAKSETFEPARQAIPMQAEVHASPAPVTFTPARKGDVMFVQAKPMLTAELRAHPVSKIEEPSARKAEIGDWETEGGKVRMETENKGYLSDSTAEAKKEAIGVSDEELHAVQEAADHIMEQNALDRRTSISPLEEKRDEFPERELKVEFAPAPAHGGFALEPPSETVAAGVKLEREEAAKADESTPLLGASISFDRVRTEFADIALEGKAAEAPKAELPVKEEAVELRSHEGYDRIKDKEEEMPRGADEKAEAEGEAAPSAPAKASKQMSVNTLIKLVVEPIARIDESKLPSLTPEIAFAAPAAPHEPTHHEYHPKHTHNDRLPGRAEHYVNQPRHQS